MRRMEDTDGCHLAVEEAIEVLVTYAGKDASQPGRLEHGGFVSEEIKGTVPKAVKQAPNVAKRGAIDVDVTAQAADKLFRCSKKAYFHPEARPTAYISQILTDPYFKPVPKHLSLIHISEPTRPY